MKRILGIDPGSRLMGIGVIESDGRYNRHIYSHTLSLGHEPSLPIRLGAIFDTVTEVIKDYAPDEFAIENVFMAKNAASALKLGQARGAAICAAVTSNLSVAEYSPKEIKQSVVGKGSADKTQVQHMVKILLNLQGKLQADAADALAIALCHGHTSALKAKLQNYSN